jgi:putative transposase
MRKADQKINLFHLCQLFDVPISSYYYRPVVKPNDEVYRDKLSAIHNENLQSYGQRRMKAALADNGINLGVFKIARLMKQAGIIAKIPKKPHYYPSGKQ